MADWLARAQREIQQLANVRTAEAAERIPTAVMAVSLPDNADFLRASNGSIGSTPAMAFQKIVGFNDDDWRTCDQCTNLIAQRCQAAKIGKIVASWNYEPIRNLSRRCETCQMISAKLEDEKYGRHR